MSAILIGLALVIAYKWGYARGGEAVQARWAAATMEPQLRWARQSGLLPPR